ncbi:MAG TPA: glycosyltransferase family 2 protein [Steroidobacteraceae bacterium]|nr:glycosyltransferase family 2 protein [Steroidobacteraceae bacterium]
MTLLAHVLLLALALPAWAACLYLLGATLLSAALPLPPDAPRQFQFDVVVPAHNEAGVIERTIASLQRIDWPRDRFRIWVVADNCSDATADLARAAGAHVLERHDTQLRGKGYALLCAFKESLAQAWAQAVVVIDADAEVSANLLAAFAARLALGAQAVQVHYGVRNPHASWRTRLITMAKASFHIVRSRARERLGVSCGIRGNGWCVTHDLLKSVPYAAFSLTEDLQYGIDIGLAGYRVVYADEAHSDADMVSGEQVARKQRQRWESGRFQLVRTKTLPLLGAALKRRSAVCLDLAFDLLVLPLSYVVLNVIALILAAAALAAWQKGFYGWVWSGAACGLILGLYVLRGWQLSGVGAQGLLDLARAPGFLIWKVVLMLKPHKSAEWVRTDRESD